MECQKCGIIYDEYFECKTCPHKPKVRFLGERWTINKVAETDKRFTDREIKIIKQINKLYFIGELVLYIGIGILLFLAVVGIK